MTAKSLNPYDTSAPTELFGDPVVRVFDARMPGRPGPPLQFSMLGAPRMVRFLADESLALATSSGQFLLSKEPFTGESKSESESERGAGRWMVDDALLFVGVLCSCCWCVSLVSV